MARNTVATLALATGMLQVTLHGSGGAVIGTESVRLLRAAISTGSTYQVRLCEGIPGGWGGLLCSPLG